MERNETENLYTVKEAAEYLGVSHRTVCDWIRNGEIGCYRVGKGWYIRIGQHHIDEYLAERDTTKEPTA